MNNIKRTVFVDIQKNILNKRTDIKTIIALADKFHLGKEDTQKLLDLYKKINA